MSSLNGSSNWDKKLAREAMKWGYAPTDLNLYEEVTEAFDDPWKVMSPEDRRLAHKLFIQSMRTMAASPKQKGLIKQLNDLLVKYKLKPIPEEVLDENKSVAQKNLDKSQFEPWWNVGHGLSLVPRFLYGGKFQREVPSCHATFGQGPKVNGEVLHGVEAGTR
jgi:hypothetical protein